VAKRGSNLNDFIDNLDEMLLPDLAKETEKESVFNMTPTRAAPGLLKLDSTQSEEHRTLFPFGLHNASTIFQEAMRSKTLS